MPVATIADLPLELVEEIARHLDVKEVLELMMVNKRIYSSYAMDQSIVLGKHVAEVALGQKPSPENCVWKFVDCCSSIVDLDLDTTLPFAKRVDSCDKLVFHERRHTDGMLLDQLKSVNQLEVDVYTKEHFLKFLTNFRGSVKKNAKLRIGIGSFEEDQAMKERLGKFIENQLNGCEKVALGPGLWTFEGCFYVYHEAMMKTQIKMIQIEAPAREFNQILYLIVNQGIPSKNSEAWIHIEEGFDQTEVIRARVGDFLSQVQGLQRVDGGENHLALVSRANELLRQIYENANCLFDENTSCFRRRIDPVTSCIYVFRSDRYLQFLAFYMPSQCNNL